MSRLVLFADVTPGGALWVLLLSVAGLLALIVAVLLVLAACAQGDRVWRETREAMQRRIGLERRRAGGADLPGWRLLLRAWRRPPPWLAPRRVSALDEPALHARLSARLEPLGVLPGRGAGDQRTVLRDRHTGQVWLHASEAIGRDWIDTLVPLPQIPGRLRPMPAAG